MDGLYWGLFVAFFVFRYLRTVVGVFTFLLYKPKPVEKHPAFLPADVTVVIPTTFKNAGELVRCLHCVLASAPAAVCIVTSNANVELVKTSCTFSVPLVDRKIQVLGVEKLNKRKQMIVAMKEVQTEIVVFADDDVFWPSNYLSYLLAIFEDPEVGAGGTRQRVRRNEKPDFWNFLGIAYLERRVFNNITTNAIDGSLSTLSGRTAAYRTAILQAEDFYQYFWNDAWRGRRLLTDDDKCLTRYVYSHGWKIAIQSDARSVLETTMEGNSKYIAQCLRWTRAHWRGNFTVMANETYWRSFGYWWGFYVIYIGQFQTPAIFVDGALFALLAKAVHGSSGYAPLAHILLGSWIFAAKIVKLVPHLCRHPQDLMFLPISILFGYMHGLLNIYALCTLQVSHWGSQDLDKLRTARAEGDSVVPLLRAAMAGDESYQEPTPHLAEGPDYFSAAPTLSGRSESGSELKP